MQVAAEQPQQSVAQVSPIEQHQDQEHQHDTGVHQRSASDLEPLQRARQRGRHLLLDLNALHSCGTRLATLARSDRALDLLLRRLKSFHRAVEHSWRIDARAEVAQLALDVALVRRQFCTQRTNLATQQKPSHHDQRQGHRDNEDDGYRPRHAPSLQAHDKRVEYEAEQECHRQWHEDLAAEVEPGDHDRCREQAECELQAGKYRSEMRERAGTRTGRLGDRRQIGDAMGVAWLSIHCRASLWLHPVGSQPLAGRFRRVASAGPAVEPDCRVSDPREPKCRECP